MGNTVTGGGNTVTGAGDTATGAGDTASTASGTVIGGDLFQRFFLRFLLGIIVAFLLFLPLVHLFQRRFIYDEWREDLRQEAHWLALHTHPDTSGPLAGAWRTTHSTIRLTIFEDDGSVRADSKPELEAPDLEALREGREPRHLLAVAEKSPHGGWIVMSRAWVPAFPIGLQWELVAAAVLIVGLIAAFLYPLVRSMRATLQQLTGIAGEVSSGHFGKTLPVHRSDELGVLVQAFNGMSAKLEEAERLNTRLLHDVSHELRSPLARIQVLAQTVERRPEQAHECLTDIEQEVALLDRLVGELVETARIESDKRSASPQDFSLLEWSHETLRRLESRARAQRIDWVTHLPAEDREVCGDPQRLGQALGNLVDNAIHALDGRPDARIEVSVSVAADAWTVVVGDNGPGIPEADLPHVFRRFYRVEEHRGRERGGVGLGLSLVRAIADAHGGEAAVESRAGDGTRARFTIPFRTAAE